MAKLDGILDKQQGYELEAMFQGFSPIKLKAIYMLNMPW